MISPRLPLRGAALVIVLGMLVLVSIVAVGFFARTVTLRKSTANELASSSARSFGDTAVNLVQAQIDHAATAGNFTAWASQPGAIRLYNSSGALQTIYRLYSASSLTTSNATELTNDLPGTPDWRNLKSLWTDLNSPVDITANGTVTRRFPILDPRSMGTIEGFGSNGTSSVAVVTGNVANRALPMPVRWLYVLRDGQIVAPTPAADGSDSVSVPGASATNPIIGRIAFWTDDATSRLNINTAGGRGNAVSSNGTFWDTPRFDAPDDRNLARFQPASGEFQRYPGHPATTTLGKIFPSLNSTQLLQLTPRYIFGGSRDATAANTANNTSKVDRLLSSPGELLFTPARALSPLVTADELEGVKFLLTAHSRSPELTLFSTPRVSIWPVHANTSTSWRSPKDLLLARAATVNGNPYYFTRSDPLSTRTDVNLSRNLSLLSYLDELTTKSLPGWGASFNAKYPSDRRDLLTKIFDYIRITNLQDPLLAPANRYSSNATVSAGSVAPSTHPTWNTQGFGRFEVLADAGFLFVGVGQGNLTVNGSTTNATTVLAGQPGLLHGSGNSTFWADTTTRRPADNRVAVQALFLMSFFNPAMGWVGANSTFSIRVNGLDSARLDGIPMGFPASDWAIVDPSWGLPLYLRNYGGNIDSRLLVFGRQLASGGPGRVFPFFSSILPIPANPSSTSFRAGEVTVEIYTQDGARTADPSKLVSTYRLDFAKLPPDIPTPILAGNRGFGHPESSTEKNHDRFRLLTEQNATPPRKLSSTSNRTATMAYLVEGDRDVYYTLAPSGNYTDYRMLARKEIPSEAFQPHPRADGTHRTAYLGMLNLGWQMGGSGPFGKLVQGASYFSPTHPVGPADIPEPFPNPFQPAVPSGLDGAFAANDTAIPGDWDNGMGIVMDGPYINKPDDGNQRNIASGGTPFFDDDWYRAELINSGLFSPNRMIPSPGMFGSLPSGGLSARPWQTLLFRPGAAGHKGLESPRDHLLLDLFWMPVVEPYAISEPFSTAGKVNLNYQIQPFIYIDRKTPILSVLDSERVARVRMSEANNYKRRGSGLNSDARLPLNLGDAGGTLRQFREKFEANEIFKSHTEICDIFLVPQGYNWPTDSAARNAWYGDDFALVGDNTRERPYTNLLGRVTTKSNTFTVFYTVQSLKNPVALPQGTWNEARGIVLSEYRGHTTLERYINPNDTRIPDYATDFTKIGADPLDRYYNWRIIEQSQFAP